MSTETNLPSSGVEELRSVTDMTKPDRRWLCFRRFDMASNAFRPITLDDHHSTVFQFALDAAVPEDIRIQWDTGRNLWLYAWHVWRFFAVAELQAYATLEMALRMKLGGNPEDRRTLRKLLDEAVHKRLLWDDKIEDYRLSKKHQAMAQQHSEQHGTDSDFREAEANLLEDPQAYCKMLAEIFPRLRNHFAHGSSSLHLTNTYTFSVCRDLINQLFSS